MTTHKLETAALRHLIERPTATYLWGRRHIVIPRLVPKVFGDGGQLIWIGPIVERPHYYVVRIDSCWTLEGEYDDERCLRYHLGYIYEAIADYFGEKTEEDEPNRFLFPILNVSGRCEWGELTMPPTFSAAITAKTFLRDSWASLARQET